MKIVKIVAIVIIVAGVLGLIYGGFTYTKKTDTLKLGAIDISISKKQTVNIPIWAGIVTIAVGGGLLIFSLKKNK